MKASIGFALVAAFAPAVSVMAQDFPNKPGASGKVGIQALLSAPRDGYTNSVLTYTYLVILPATDAQGGDDPEKDLRPLGNGIVAPTALVVHSSVPATTLQEAVAVAKKEGGRLNYGTFGIASSVRAGPKRCTSCRAST